MKDEDPRLEQIAARLVKSAYDAQMWNICQIVLLLTHDRCRLFHEEHITVGWTRRKDGGWQTTEESGRVTWAGQEETREAKAEMGGLC